MNVVEALNAWIDQGIDDMTDAELERLLRILDEVSASELSETEVDDVADDDVDQLVELVGGSRDSRDYTRAVMRASLFDEEPRIDLAAAAENDLNIARDDQVNVRESIEPEATPEDTDLQDADLEATADDTDHTEDADLEDADLEDAADDTDLTDADDNTIEAVSYTHLTLPTICSV